VSEERATLAPLAYDPELMYNNNNNNRARQKYATFIKILFFVECKVTWQTCKNGFLPVGLVAITDDPRALHS
jgi:hypothetical protein